MSEPAKKTNTLHNQSGNFTQIPNEVIRLPLLSEGAQRLFIYLGSYSPAFPSYLTIQSDLRMKDKTIAKKINELKKYGMIEVIKNKGQSYNNYIIKPIEGWIQHFIDFEKLHKEKKQKFIKETQSKKRGFKNKSHTTSRAGDSTPSKGGIIILSNNTKKNHWCPAHFIG